MAAAEAETSARSRAHHRSVRSGNGLRAQNLNPRPTYTIPSWPTIGDILTLSKPFQILTSLGPGLPDGNSGPKLGLCPVWCRSCWLIGQPPGESWAPAGVPRPATSIHATARAARILSRDDSVGMARGSLSGPVSRRGVDGPVIASAFLRVDRTLRRGRRGLTEPPNLPTRAGPEPQSRALPRGRRRRGG